MIPEEYKELVDKLVTLTENRKINWETTSDTTKFSFGGSKVSALIYNGNDFQTGEDFVRLELLDILGDQIDGFYVDEHDEDFPKMLALYNSSKRNALKIEESISSLLNDLNKIQ